jgi:HlyD family secretion protein
MMIDSAKGRVAEGDAMSSMFRPTAVERAASPEHLDATISMVSAKSWLAVVGLAVIAIAVLAWGWLGSIPTRICGQAIIVIEGPATHAMPAGSPRCWCCRARR